VEKDDWAFLQSRVLVNLPLEERVAFDNAICLFPGHSAVDDKNFDMLEKLGASVARIEATYHGVSSEEGSKVRPDHCNKMGHTLDLSVGCRVSSNAVKVNREFCEISLPQKLFAILTCDFDDL